MEPFFTTFIMLSSREAKLIRRIKANCSSDVYDCIYNILFEPTEVDLIRGVLGVNRSNEHTYAIDRVFDAIFNLD